MSNSIYEGTYEVHYSQDNSSWNESSGSSINDYTRNYVIQITSSDSTLHIEGFDFPITECDQRMFYGEHSTLSYSDYLSEISMSYSYSSSNQFSGGTYQTVITGTKTSLSVTPSPNPYHDNFEANYAFTIREFVFDPYWGEFNDTIYYDTAFLDIFQYKLMLDTSEFSYGFDLPAYRNYYTSAGTYTSNSYSSKKEAELFSDSVHFLKRTSGASWEISGKKM